MGAADVRSLPQRLAEGGIVTQLLLRWVGVVIMELIFAGVTIIGSAKFAAWLEWLRVNKDGER